jgi:hypothetical protein
MAELSGRVAILNEDATAVVAIRDLGNVPVPVKGNLCRPFEEIIPEYDPNTEILVHSADVIAADKVTRTFQKQAIDFETIDQDKLNNALVEDGSVVRALALLILDEFNAHAKKINDILDAADAASSLATFKTAMAAINNQPIRTVEQLKSALITKMRG